MYILMKQLEHTIANQEREYLHRTKTRWNYVYFSRLNLYASLYTRKYLSRMIVDLLVFCDH